MSNKAVAQLLHRHEHTVKDLDRRYMQAWLPRRSSVWMNCSSRRAPVSHGGLRPGARTADLGRGDGPDRSRSGSLLCRAGPEKTARTRLAVMDMWKAFRNSVRRMLPRYRYCSTNSTSCAIWLLCWARSAAPSTSGSRRGTAPLSRARAHAALPVRQSHASRSPLAPETAAGQQALGHRLPAEGGVLATPGLSPVRLTASVLHPLA
jgi:hypothetical protein